ncbi:MAG: hypothetical protein GX434_12185 [Peptococcaceae bacterium]|nr:hypothetical protein [Peptococcaceae bacterium]
MSTKIAALLLAFFLFTGCTPAADPNKQTPPAGNVQTSPTSPASPTSPSPRVPGVDQTPGIGGISLGDSTAKVTNILGSEYQEKYIDEDGYFGEPYYERTYSVGIQFILGKNTAKVLQITSTAENMATDMGIKIGDPAANVLQKYREKYKEPVSQHGAGTLEGWFEVEDGQLMIFDFNANDETMVNQKISKDAKVERIILAYSKFMD